MSFLGDLGRVAIGVGTGGLSEIANEVTGGGVWGNGSNFFGLGDLLRGEKSPSTPDKWLELDPSLKKVVDQARGGQQLGLSGYESELNRLSGVDPAKLAGIVSAKKEKLARAQNEDMKRRAQQLSAQRGLSRSSIGLNAMLNADKEQAEKISEVRANKPLLEQDIANQKIGSLRNATGGINEVLQSPGQQRDFVSGKTGGVRSGGLMGLAGLGLGAYYGGPQGAYAGQQLGQGLANF